MKNSPALLEGMPSLPPGAYGENRGLPAQPQVPNGDHGHVMTAVEPMIESRRTGLARPRQRGSVAARFIPPTFRVRAPCPTFLLPIRVVPGFQSDRWSSGEAAEAYPQRGSLI